MMGGEWRVASGASGENFAFEFVVLLLFFAL